MFSADALAVAVIWVLKLAAAALHIAFTYVRRPMLFVYNRAPLFLLDIAAFFRWHRLHRFLLVGLRLFLLLQAT